MMATSAADIPLDCYMMSNEMTIYWEELFLGMDNNPSRFLQAFLFTQMGNANKFRKAIMAISENGDDGN